MPGTTYANIKRPRVYEALRKKGYTKARAAQIANSKGADTSGFAVAPHGPGSLLSVPGMSAPRRRAKEGDPSERDYVRSEDGKFSSSPGGGAAEGAPAEAQPKPVPESKRLTKAHITADDAKVFLSGLGLDPQLSEALSEWISGATADEPEDMAVNRAAADALAALGLVEIRPGQEGQGSVTIDLSGAGKKLLTTTEQGDIAGGMRVVEAAHTRHTKRLERETARQAKRAAVAARRPAKPAKPATAAPSPKPSAPKPSGGGGGGDAADDAMARRRELLQKARLLFGQKAMRPGRKRAWRQAYQQAKATGHAPDQARRKAARALRERDLRRAKTGYDRAVARLSVYKDATGALRWITRTTTAYRDRDDEILSTTALDRAVARMRETGQYGPLRYWHVGTPTPDDPARPWGPGLDLGMCDYSIRIGNTLVESGTFADPQFAQAVGADPNTYELSPGFYHAPTAPDAAGVYDDIQIFERSLIPTAMGHAANLFTGITVKDTPMSMTPQEFQRRLKAFAADMADKGVPEAAVQQALAGLVAGEKAASARGIAYKSADAPAIYLLPDGTPGVIQDGQFVALKAATTKAPMPPAEMVEAGATEVLDGMAEENAEDESAEESEEPILSPMEIEAIASRTVQLLMEAMDGLTAKMAAVDEELKGRGYSRMKEASDLLAARVTEIGGRLDRFTAAVEGLVSDLPASGHRASQGAVSAVRADDPLVAVAAKNVGTQVAAPRTIIDQIAATLPVSWPYDVPPPTGVNPAQHSAPGTR